ncbi:hypothetical protein M0812_00058 [Anaeramoeba flamelloides]|uniref:Uncharacterized protein n=1 Tax=Anaeramoeba flamelloides TaxID=1746091 RepID=A0AAV8A4B6_9EUKA|nr:hypothetical protein M0812_00058 [Anaeramoeba flamelloides]
MNDRIKTTDFFGLEEKLLNLDSDEFNEITNYFSSLTPYNLFDSTDLPSLEENFEPLATNELKIDFKYPSTTNQRFTLLNNSNSDSSFCLGSFHNSEKENTTKTNINENKQETEINKITKQKNNDNNINYKEIELFPISTLQDEHNIKELSIEDLISKIETNQKDSDQKQKSSLSRTTNIKRNIHMNPKTNSNVNTIKKKYENQDCKHNEENSVPKTQTQTKYRKREVFENDEELDEYSKKRTKSNIVESGKQIFKLVAGQMWVISGGSSYRKLSPYTNKLITKLGQVLKASDKETKNFENNLKYLLTNSRRTFTEFILEILIGVLSLIHLEDEIGNVEENNNQKHSLEDWIKKDQSVVKDCDTKIETEQEQENHEDKDEKVSENLDSIRHNANLPQISKKLFQTLFQIAETHYNKSNQDLAWQEIQKINEKEESLKQELLKIYEQIFSEQVLFYWFDKRFVDQVEHIFEPELRTKFYKDHFFAFGRSKFILSCLILAKELVDNHEICKNYFDLIDFENRNDPLKLYSNNRCKKQKVIKNLIVRFSLNGGEFWNVLSNDYMANLKFSPENITEYFPFKSIIFHPLVSENGSIKKYKKASSHKKRVTTSQRQKINSIINLNWCLKKSIF